MTNNMLLYAHLSDNELIDKVKNESVSCFEVLVRRHNQSLHRIGCMYGIDNVTVEDLVHDTHILSHKFLKDFNIRSSYRTWLVRVMINKCEQHLSENSDNSIGFSSEPAGMLENDMFTFTERKSTIDADNELEKAITRLKQPLRSVFMLKEIEGYTHTEAADFLNIPESMVRVRLNRAKIALQGQYKSRYYYNDIFLLPDGATDRIVNRVMGRIDMGEYHYEKALMPRA